MNSIRTNPATAFVVASLLLLSAPVSAQQVKSNEQLSGDMAVVQRDLASIQTEMQGLRRLLDNRAMLELFQRMDDLAAEVSELRGLIEEQTHDLAGLKKRQRELYLDIDRRLRELEITSSRAPVAAVPSLPVAETPASEPMDTPVVSERPPQPDVPLPSVSAPVPSVPVSPAGSGSGSGAAPVAAASVPDTSVSEEREGYQKAFDMLKEGRYQMANAAFREFLVKYPNGSYSGNAQYWLGESNYVTRDFEQAVKEFKTVTAKFPTSNKVPDAMLKLGYTYYELRQFGDARAVLEALQKQFPKSTHARLAGKRLARMQREGH